METQRIAVLLAWTLLAACTASGTDDAEGNPGQGGTGPDGTDLCALADCDAHATCHNDNGKITCDCNDGYVGSGRVCRLADPDACAVDNGGCDVNATCDDSTGAAVCACKDGYTGNGRVCTAVTAGPCATNHGGCDLNATCDDSTGAAVCACKDGYTGNGRVCTAVTAGPCATNHGGCDLNATCDDSTGAAVCACKEGYSGDGRSCTRTGSGDCATNNGGCDVHATCAAGESGVTCECQPGYDGTGFSCRSLRYDEAAFKATHNSYSGGGRRSLAEQLDAGVRVLELDVHNDDYPSKGYRVGHDFPGHDVALGGGNPSDPSFSLWLGVIADWSRAHPSHAPLTLLVDLKDDVSRMSSYTAGNHSALNAALEAAFGETLYRAENHGASWPTVDELRGRVLVVLSGDEGARRGYLYDAGLRPTIAVNSLGNVVELHHAPAGELWFWTGQLRADGHIEWKRHAYYDTGRNASVALNDDGWIVEVHEHQDQTTYDKKDNAYYRVGRLGADYEIAWVGTNGTRFPDTGKGNEPTLIFDALGGFTLTERHMREGSGVTYEMRGTLDSSSGQLSWTTPVSASGASRFDRMRATAGARMVEVLNAASGPFSQDTLHTATYEGGLPVVARERLRYPQLAFSEHQRGGSAEFSSDGALFNAASSLDAGVMSWASSLRSGGSIVRLWGYGESTGATAPPLNAAATDAPFADWYVEYCRAARTVE